MENLREFFRTLPDAGREFWEFGDGFYGLAILIGSIVLIALFLALAKRLRSNHEWLSAVMGVMAITIGMWWAFGILPSAWVYYVDGARDVLEGAVIPAALPAMEDFYQVFRDSVVIVETAVALVAVAMITRAAQKRFPRELGEGEEGRTQTGGYR